MDLMDLVELDSFREETILMAAVVEERPEQHIIEDKMVLYLDKLFLGQLVKVDNREEREIIDLAQLALFTYM
jgi:hypothetical protein